MATAVWDGHVFVNLSREAAAVRASTWPASTASSRPGAWGTCGAPSAAGYQLKANWKLVIQNYSECLHCPIAHPLLNKQSHYMSGDNEPPRPTYLGGRMELRDGVKTLSLDGQTSREPLPGLSAEDRRHVYYYALLPNLLLNLHPDYMLTFQIWPLAVDRTEVVCEWHFHPDEIAKPGLRPEGRGRVLGPDQPAGLGALRPGPAGHLDAGLPARALLEPRGAARRLRPLRARTARAYRLI